MYISYSAAQDPFHAIFRMLCIFQLSNDKHFEIDRVCITDFYVCFPWAVETIEGSRKVAGFIAAQNQVNRAYRKNDYEQIPEARVMYKRMRPAQLAALNSLASYGYLSKDDFRLGQVVRTEKILPPEIQEAVNRFADDNRILFEFLTKFLSALPLSSSDGLKAKTGLEEFRYDVSA